MKKVLISIFTLIFIISMVSVVNAASGSISAVTSSNQVVKGNTFTVTLSGEADNPIDGMYTKLSYDSSILELTTKTPGINYSDNSGTGEIYIINNSSESSQTSGTLYTLTFKVLDGAAEGETIIGFDSSELHLNDNGTINKVSSEINNVTVTIKSDDTTVGGNNTVDTNNSSNGSNSNKNSNTSSNHSTSNTSSNSSNKTTKLPQTGAEVTSIIAIAILSIFAVISYISYKKYKNI